MAVPKGRSQPVMATGKSAGVARISNDYALNFVSIKNISLEGLMRISHYMKNLAFALALTLFAMPAMAKDTPVSISVLANDAKFIGTSMGSTEIIIRDAGSHEILAKGLTKGSTGDTSLIMKENIARHEVLRTRGSARFDATLDLAKPKKVIIEARGPLAQPQSIQTVREERILIPGKNYADRNAIVLTMHGMSVDILSPAAHLKRDFDPDGSFTLEVNAMKMCGCPLRAKGPWNAENYEVEAHIYKDGDEFIKTIALDHSGDDSRFTADVSMAEKGTYEIIVTAHDPRTKDSGMDATTIVLQ